MEKAVSNLPWFAIVNRLTVDKEISIGFAERLVGVESLGLVHAVSLFTSRQSSEDFIEPDLENVIIADFSAKSLYRHLSLASQLGKKNQIWIQLDPIRGHNKIKLLSLAWFLTSL